MGAAVSQAGPHIVLPNGQVKSCKCPLTVAEVLKEFPDHFLSDLQSAREKKRVRLPLDCVLPPGEYFVLKASRRSTRLWLKTRNSRCLDTGVVENTTLVQDIKRAIDRTGWRSNRRWMDADSPSDSVKGGDLFTNKSLQTSNMVSPHIPQYSDSESTSEESSPTSRRSLRSMSSDSGPVNPETAWRKYLLGASRSLTPRNVLDPVFGMEDDEEESSDGEHWRRGSFSDESQCSDDSAEWDSPGRADEATRQQNKASESESSSTSDQRAAAACMVRTMSQRDRKWRPSLDIIAEAAVTDALKEEDSHRMGGMAKMRLQMRRRSIS